MDYYVAEISFDKFNPKNVYIVRSFGKRDYEVLGYDEIDEIRKSDVYYFKIIRKIDMSKE